MAVAPLLVVARLRIGRAIRNVYDGVMNGEPWAVGLAVVLLLLALAFGGYFAFQAYQEAADDSEDMELTSEEKNLMNRF